MRRTNRSGFCELLALRSTPEYRRFKHFAQASQETRPGPLQRQNPFECKLTALVYSSVTALMVRAVQSCRSGIRRRALPPTRRCRSQEDCDIQLFGSRRSRRPSRLGLRIRLKKAKRAEGHEPRQNYHSSRHRFLHKR